MNILMVGDVVARPGRKVLTECLARVIDENHIDFTVVNIENAAGGFGLTKKILKQFDSLNIDVMTSGNHIWDKAEMLDIIDDSQYLLRPHNYPANTPGTGWLVRESSDGIKVGVLNVMGQVFMHPTLDSPFDCVDQVLAEKPDDVQIVLVDFHAEATSEKITMGWYLDGRVSAVVGTHTHVPTADERVLPGKTAYISDLGMTGCYDSVIGSKIECVLRRTIEKLPSRLEPAVGAGTLCGVIIDVDESTGRARAIQRIRLD